MASLHFIPPPLPSVPSALLSSKWPQSENLSHLKMEIFSPRAHFSFSLNCFYFSLQARRRNVMYAQSIHHRAIWAHRQRPALTAPMERPEAMLAPSQHYVSWNKKTLSINYSWTRNRVGNQTINVGKRISIEAFIRRCPVDNLITFWQFERAANIKISLPGIREKLKKLFEVKLRLERCKSSMRRRLRLRC